MIVAAMARGREEWSRVTLLDALHLGLSVGAFGLAVTAAKVVSGLPGHAVAFWLPVLIASRWTRPKPGTAFITALTGGILFSAFPRFGPGKELVSYVAAAWSAAWRSTPRDSTSLSSACRPSGRWVRSSPKPS
jgi:phosphotransferase system  glucose/maltose/N-acetylglucosamine-specific IIC component